MEYVRQNLEFVPAGAYCRAQGMIRAEIRDRTLKLRILLDGMTPAPFGTYQAEMICVREGSYRDIPWGAYGRIAGDEENFCTEEVWIMWMKDLDRKIFNVSESKKGRRIPRIF